MESYQIISGFTDIKSELRAKTKIDKDMTELQLWFSFEDDLLCVHDYDKHAKNIILAIYYSENQNWSIIYKKKGNGYNLIDTVVRTTAIDKITEKFNKLYRLNGFGPFGRI